jgi:AAA domain (dynein-related subfamily)
VSLALLLHRHATMLPLLCSICVQSGLAAYFKQQWVEPTSNFQCACSSPLLVPANGSRHQPPAKPDPASISAALAALVATSQEALQRAPGAAGTADAAAHALAAAALRDALTRATAAAAAVRAAFVWEDGPLVTAMRDGDIFLIDEINLADDAVLERLNSVLEPGRALLLAEKGGSEAEKIVAAEGFRVVATMNPGGDHGKRELSPALMNRFTQVQLLLLSSCFWLPAVQLRCLVLGSYAFILSQQGRFLRVASWPTPVA